MENLYFLNKFFVWYSLSSYKTSISATAIKRECPLKPSHIANIWHMMKNQNFSYSSLRYPRVSLETWCDFFLEIFF